MSVLVSGKGKEKEGEDDEEDELSSVESSDKSQGRGRAADSVTVSQHELTSLASEVLGVLFEVLDHDGQLPRTPRMNKKEQVGCDGGWAQSPASPPLWCACMEGRVLVLRLMRPGPRLIAGKNAYGGGELLAEADEEQLCPAPAAVNLALAHPSMG